MPLDEQGGQLPTADYPSLEKSDFITYPSDVEGGNCGNCRFNEGGVCQFHDEEKQIDLRGQQVTEKNCCGEWDAPGVLRAWEDDKQKVKRWKRVNLL